MKYVAAFLLPSLLLLLMLHATVPPVNIPSGNSAQWADGNPAPPFPPQALLADGNPAPPFPPNVQSVVA